eukprot:225248-Alexandrium_andersonii.AAC.1
MCIRDRKGTAGDAVARQHQVNELSIDVAILAKASTRATRALTHTRKCTNARATTHTRSHSARARASTELRALTHGDG